MTLSPRELAQLVDHTLLAPTASIADVAELALPLHDLTEFVHRVRERDLNLDGFVDALDGRPARGFSTHYLDQYSLGQVEARERAR